MLKKYMSVVLSISIITTLVGCSDNEMDLVENILKNDINYLDFDFKVNPSNFKLDINVNEKVESVSEAIDEREIKNLKESNDEVSWSYPNDNIDISIKKEENYLDVNIKSTTKEENEFSWPKVSGESYSLPINEGKFIPSNDKYWKEFLDEQIYNVIESFSMQFFSVNKSDYTLTYIIKNKFNNEIKFDTKDNINFTFKHLYPSINENREYGFRIYVTEKNIVDIAKTYKNYIVERGEFTTLKEKSKYNENIEKLYGAPHIYFWDKSIIAINDIKWNLLKTELSSNLENHIKDLLRNNVEDSQEIIDVFDAIKNQDYIDNYQKNKIVQAFNEVMKLKDFYSEDIFKNIDKTIKEKLDNIYNLGKLELVELNKILLKSELKNSTIDIKDWGKSNNIDILEEMKSSGIDNAWIGFDDIEAGYVSKEFVSKAKEYGYLIAPYDSYHSIHKPGEEKWSTAKFEDTTLYENATIENKDGEKLQGFQGEGRKLNPTLSLESVKNRVSGIIDDGYGFNSWFIDCDATGEIYDDYSKEHITTQEEDLSARLKRMEYIKDEKGMVIGSEGGNDFSSNVISFAHGLETPAFSWVDEDMKKNKDSEYYVGRYYSPTGGVPEVFYKQIPIKELYNKIFISPEYSLPLFRLVYNDSVITSHHWLWGTFKIKDEVENRMLKEILYNTAPMYHIDKVEWDKHKEKIISHTKVWSDFNKEAINLEMTDFKFLSEDRLVQSTNYGDNLKVIANFSDREFNYGNDIISPNSLIIYKNNDKIVYKP